MSTDYYKKATFQQLTSNIDGNWIGIHELSTLLRFTHVATSREWSSFIDSINSSLDKFHMVRVDPTELW